MLIAAHVDGSLPLGSRNTAKWKTRFDACRGHADDVVDAEWSVDGTGIVSTSIDNSVILWDTQKGKSKVLSTEPCCVQHV